MDCNLLCTICQHDCENETCRKPDSFLLSSLPFRLNHFWLDSVQIRWKTLFVGSSKKFAIRQIERIDQIGKLPPGSKKIVKYFQVSLMRCKCQMENSTCRMVPKFSICQIERISLIKLLFSPIESSWQYWTTLGRRGGLSENLTSSLN